MCLTDSQGLNFLDFQDFVVMIHEILIVLLNEGVALAVLGFQKLQAFGQQ